MLTLRNNHKKPYTFKVWDSKINKVTWKITLKPGENQVALTDKQELEKNEHYLDLKEDGVILEVVKKERKSRRARKTLVPETDEKEVKPTPASKVVEK